MFCSKAAPQFPPPIFKMSVKCFCVIHSVTNGDAETLVSTHCSWKAQCLIFLMWLPARHPLLPWRQGQHHCTDCFKIKKINKKIKRQQIAKHRCAEAAAAAAVAKCKELCMCSDEYWGSFERTSTDDSWTFKASLLMTNKSTARVHAQAPLYRSLCCGSWSRRFG